MSTAPSFVSIHSSLQALNSQPLRLAGRVTRPFILGSPTQSTTVSARLSGITRHFSSSQTAMAPTTKNYDYIVIGGGSGGSGTSRRAAGWYGKKTALIESGVSGGTCVNVGCVPKKMTFNFASLNEAIHDAKHYGYDFSNGYSFDFKTFVDKRHARIKTLNGIYETNWGKDGIDLLKGQATFVSPHEIEIKPKEGESFRITAPHITVAVGGYPTKPESIKGSDYGITSDDFFSMEYLPKKYAIVGAGYIAVELAGMLNAMGVETHLFIRGKEVLRKFDPMVSEAITKYYEDQGVHIHKEHPGIKEVIQLKEAKDETDPREKELKLIMNDGNEMVVNELMWAIGRSPQLQHLGLDKTGVKQGKNGHIIVDKYQNTNVEGIYAIGDVTGQAELTPVAIAAGRRLSNRLFGPSEHKDDHLQYDRIPTVVFSHPPVATVGLTEPEAEEKFGKDLKIYTTKFAPMYYDPFPPEEKKKHPTLYKIICQGKDEVIVGAHLIGDVAEASQLLGVIVRNGLTKKALDDTVAVHPISMEELVTLR